MVNKNNAKNYCDGMVFSSPKIGRKLMPEELRSMIEREAMRLIDERRKAQKITVDDLARRLYPEKFSTGEQAPSQDGYGRVCGACQSRRA